MLTHAVADNMSSADNIQVNADRRRNRKVSKISPLFGLIYISIFFFTRSCDISRDFLADTASGNIFCEGNPFYQGKLDIHIILMMRVQLIRRKV